MTGKLYKCATSKEISHHFDDVQPFKTKMAVKDERPDGQCACWCKSSVNILKTKEVTDIV